MQNQVITIFAIDDDDEYLDSLEAIFKPYSKKFALIGTFSDVSDDDGVEDLLDKIDLQKPAVALMDFSFLFKGRSEDFGLDLTRKILIKAPATKVIMLVGDQEDPDEKRLNKLKRSFGAGACAYLSKGSTTQWFEGIEEALHGNRYIDPETLKVLAGSIKAGEPFNLTPREIEVIKYLSEDKIVKEIADIMIGFEGKSITVHAVNFHIKNIKVKMDVNTLHGIISKACKANII